MDAAAAAPAELRACAALEEEPHATPAPLEPRLALRVQLVRHLAPAGALRDGAHLGSHQGVEGGGCVAVEGWGVRRRWAALALLPLPFARSPGTAQRTGRRRCTWLAGAGRGGRREDQSRRPGGRRWHAHNQSTLLPEQPCHCRALTQVHGLCQHRGVPLPRPPRHAHHAHLLRGQMHCVLAVLPGRRHAWRWGAHGGMQAAACHQRCLARRGRERLTCTTPQAVTQRPHLRHFSKSMEMAAEEESCQPCPPVSPAASSASHSWLPAGQCRGGQGQGACAASQPAWALHQARPAPVAHAPPRPT